MYSCVNNDGSRRRHLDPVQSHRLLKGLVHWLPVGLYTGHFVLVVTTHGVCVMLCKPSLDLA